MTDTDFWTILENRISCSQEDFAALLEELEGVCARSKFPMYGKTVYTARSSCLYVPNVEKATQMACGKAAFSYKTTPMRDWDDAPAKIADIRKQLEEELELEFDYVLCHIYRGRDDHIGFHRDSEALNSDIVSVSLGSTRRFQLRPIEQKSGFTHEYVVNNGDVLVMWGPDETSGRSKGCQRLYKHHVPKMSMKDVIRHLEQHNVPIPPGRKTNALVDSLCEQQGVSPMRINLTFRCFE